MTAVPARMPSRMRITEWSPRLASRSDLPATGEVHIVTPLARASRVLKPVGLALLGLLVLGMMGWGVTALCYFDRASPVQRAGLAVAFAAASLATLVVLAARRWRWHALAAYLLLFAALLAAWNTMKPSNDRAWQPEVAILPYATIAGDRVTVHNVRNFDYRSETDFTPAYYDKVFDLKRLDSVDVLAS